MSIQHEKTREIIRVFEEISKIPRCSKNEEKIGQWLMNWAETNRFEAKMDRVKNIVIKVPASPGMENRPIVILQGHMDMVCEKTPDSPHDFSRDPIKFVYDGEWLTADRTTLGADNGIALAMAMVLAVDPNTPHPPLELLFTVDEETGLTGANALEKGFLDGKILINIDSEDEGVFTVGCAGGINTNLTLPVEIESISGGFNQYKITAGGMKGGHSGIDIGKGKANALRILGRTLFQVKKAGIDFRVADIKGGSAHNAIPRDAYAVVFLEDINAASEIINTWSNTFNSEYKLTDPDLAVAIADNNEGNYTSTLSAASTDKLIRFLLAIPHGVESMSQAIPGLVETSNNFANIKFEENTIKVLTSQRSSVVSKLHALTARIESVALLAGGDGRSGDGYPPWQPNMDSPLLNRSTTLYEKMFDKKPVVEVIHAGLECGIIGDKYPGMDMISIGPTLRFPHSPDEKVNIESIGKVWDFMITLLQEL